MTSVGITFEDWLALNQLYADYASTVDAAVQNAWQAWHTFDALAPRNRLASLSGSCAVIAPAIVCSLARLTFTQTATSESIP